MNFSPRLAGRWRSAVRTRGFSDVSLAGSAARREAYNPDLRATALELRGVQGDAQTALRPAAELSIGSSKISPTHGIGPGRWQDKRMDSTLGLGFTWERGGKRTLRIRQADALLAGGRAGDARHATPPAGGAA